MKRFLGWASAAVLAVVGFTACDGGGGGGGGIVGTWVMDGEKTFAPMIEKLWPAMEPLRKQMSTMTPEQKAHLPAEQREQMEQLSTKEGMKKMMAKSAEGTSFEVRGDGTFTGRTQNDKKSSVAEGTWTQSGGGYAFTIKTEDGKPATGKKGTPQSAKLEGGNLVISMNVEDAPQMPGVDMSEMKLYMKRK
jgi:hypothetical protein